MFKKNITAFSLLELLIGVLILAASSVIFFQTLLSSKSEYVFYSEHFVASALTEKVLEQCYQETELNPHGVTALGLLPGTANSNSFSTYVTNGNTVFFQTPPITENEMEPIYNLLHDNFKLKIDTVRQNGFYEVTTGFTWKTRQGSGISESFSRVLAFNGEKEVTTSFEISDSEVENRLLNAIFYIADTPLSVRFPDPSHQKFLMDLAHIYFSCFDLFSSPDFQERCRVVRDSESGFAVESQQYTQCTDGYYEIARDILHLMVAFKERLDSILKDAPTIVAQFPNREKQITQSLILKTGKFYKQLGNVFLASILKLSERYERQINHAQTQRQQRAMLQRLFNIYRVLYANRDFCSDIVDTPQVDSASQIQKKINSFIANIAQNFKYKDQTIYRLALQEANFVANQEIEARYFLPALTNQIFINIDALNKIIF